MNHPTISHHEQPRITALLEVQALSDGPLEAIGATHGAGAVGYVARGRDIYLRRPAGTGARLVLEDEFGNLTHELALDGATVRLVFGEDFFTAERT